MISSSLLWTYWPQGSGDVAPDRRLLSIQPLAQGIDSTVITLGPFTVLSSPYAPFIVQTKQLITRCFCCFVILRICCCADITGCFDRRDLFGSPRRPTHSLGVSQTLFCYHILNTQQEKIRSDFPRATTQQVC